mgnify:CR=1 FL=1
MKRNFLWWKFRFFELFVLCNFGSFEIGKDRQNLATLATRVFQEGYDFGFSEGKLEAKKEYNLKNQKSTTSANTEKVYVNAYSDYSSNRWGIDDGVYDEIYERAYEDAMYDALGGEMDAVWNID